MRGNCTPVAIQCSVYLVIAKFADSRANQNHQIKGTEYRLVKAETFADQTLDPVSLHGIPGGFDRDSRSKARMAQIIGDRQDRDQPVTGFMFATFEDPLIAGCSEQAVTAWISRRHNQPAKRLSGRQTSATLGPTRLDNEAAALGTHPGTKTVVALALEVTGLKGSFHGAVGSQNS